MSSEHDDDLSFCARLLPAVSRTFSLSIGALEPPLRDAVAVAYLLCRVLDTVEDEASPSVRGEPRERLYDAFVALMRDDRATPSGFERLASGLGLGAGEGAGELCARAGSVFRVFRRLPANAREAIRPGVLEMARGMRSFTTRADREGGLRLSDMAELELYCYFVAGTVGEILTALFAGQMGEPASAAVLSRAVHFGIGLQLVNIVKDVAEDHARGTCYVPEELARDHGVALGDLLSPGMGDRALMLRRAMCARARAHLAHAEEYALAWPPESAGQVRLFCAVPLALALATLRELEAAAPSAGGHGGPVKVSRALVARLLADARLAVDRDDTLRWMLAYYASGAYARWEPIAAAPPG
jgi:farnesyl-diphosphate farnesyltransferase